MDENRTILIIDDDLDYCCLLEIAFQEAKVHNPIEVVHDGWSAVDYLQQHGMKNLDGEVLGLILLDLRMPGLSGLEVLRWIRRQPPLVEVPTVVFTGLEAGNELSQACELGATELRTKPFSYRELIQEAKSLRDTYIEPTLVKHAA